MVRRVQCCNGWSEQCSYCDRRLTPWVLLEEVNTVLPSTPGVYVYGWLPPSKSTPEVVYIGMTETSLKERISQINRSLQGQEINNFIQKHKGSIMVRFLDDLSVGMKDSCNLCAHWRNFGELPRCNFKWPGKEDVLKRNGYLCSLNGIWAR